MEVEYNYNPPKGDQAFMYAEVFQDGGYKIGRSWSATGGTINIPYATSGKVKISIEIDFAKIMAGMGGAPGNTSSSIVFYLAELVKKPDSNVYTKSEKRLEKKFKFNHAWGPDDIFHVSATKNTKKLYTAFDILVAFAWNHDRFDYFTAPRWQDHYVEIEVTPFLNGKVVGGKNTDKLYPYPPTYGPVPRLLSQKKITVGPIGSGQNTIDEVEVNLNFVNDYVGKTFTYYKKKFKVTPK